MPRKRTSDDDMPRRRRGSREAAVEPDSEHGLVMSIFLLPALYVWFARDDDALPADRAEE